MNAPATVMFRLLGALEDLVTQEAMQLAGENFEAVRQTQERAAPLVTELARLGRMTAIPAVRPRIEALLARRRQNQERLSGQIQRVREALQGTQAKRLRIAQIAPAYGRQTPIGSLRQLSVQG